METITTVTSGCLLDDDYDNDLGCDYLGSNGRRKLLILKDLRRFGFPNGLHRKQRNNRV